MFLSDVILSLITKNQPLLLLFIFSKINKKVLNTNKKEKENYCFFFVFY